MSRDKPGWIDKPRNVTLLVYALLAVCLLLAAADLFYLKHGHFGWENWFGFHAFYGFRAGEKPIFP